MEYWELYVLLPYGYGVFLMPNNGSWLRLLAPSYLMGDLSRRDKTSLLFVYVL